MPTRGISADARTSRPRTQPRQHRAAQKCPRRVGARRGLKEGRYFCNTPPPCPYAREAALHQPFTAPPRSLHDATTSPSRRHHVAAIKTALEPQLPQEARDTTDHRHSAQEKPAGGQLHRRANNTRPCEYFDGSRMSTKYERTLRRPLRTTYKVPLLSPSARASLPRITGSCKPGRTPGDTGKSAPRTGRD